MRVAVNATIVDEIPSGLGIYTINIITELWKIHKELDIFTSHPGAFGEVAVIPVTSLVRPSHGVRGHLARFLWSQSVYPLRAKSMKTDVVFIPTQLEGVIFPYLPQVITVHDVLPLRYSEEYPRMKYYFQYCLPTVLRRSTTIIAVSESTKKDIITFYGINDDKIKVIYEGFHHTFDSKRSDDSFYLVREKYHLPPYILYVGNLLPHKNLNRLIEAYSLVSKAIPHVLIIIGRKDQRFFPALEMRAAELKVKERVLFFDYIDQVELPHFYRAAETFVFPSLYEGFGLPPLEAMASGTPVICSNISSLPEVVGDAGIYVNPEDPRMVADSIKRVLGDEKLRENLISKGYERAKLFSWQKAARETLKVLRESTS